MAFDADRDVAQRCEDARESPCADLGRIITEGDVTDPVEAVLDGPASVHETEQVLDTRSTTKV
jgi:uncharacterized protein YfcZ (UPF0381/DUF406 family)